MAELTFRTAGESHGPGIYTLVDGLPQGLELNTEFIDAELRRRQARLRAEPGGGRPRPRGLRRGGGDVRGSRAGQARKSRANEGGG